MTTNTATQNRESTDVPWLSASELSTWIKFTAVLELLPSALDSQLNHDAGLTHFEYYCMAMLSDAPERTLRIKQLAARTNSTLPRISRVLNGMERRGLVVKSRCVEDARASNITLSDEGWEKLKATAPGHVRKVRSLVYDALTPEQQIQLGEISKALLQKLDPDNAFGPQR